MEQLFLSIFHNSWQVHLGGVETVDLGFEKEVACVFNFFKCIHCPSCTEPLRQPPQYLLCIAPASALARVGVVLSFP